MAVSCLLLVYLHQTWGFCKAWSAFYDCGSIVANPIIYRLEPSPSRFENRQSTSQFQNRPSPLPGQSLGIWPSLSSVQRGIWPKMRPARWGIWLSCQNVCQRSEIKDFAILWYLTIRPVSRKGYGSIAHEAKPNGLLTHGPWGQRV